MVIRWRGRELTCEEQVANACDSFVDLSPASEAPALAVTAAWAALLPNTDTPLIWERTEPDGDCEQEGC